MDTLEQLIASKETQRAQIQSRWQAATDSLTALMNGAKAEGRANLNTDENTRAEAFMATRGECKTELAAIDAKLTDWRGQLDDDRAYAARSGRDTAAAATRDAANAAAPASERRVGGAVVTKDQRTYAQHKSRSGEASFFRDAYLFTQRGDVAAQERLTRHAHEMEVEREAGHVKSTRAQTTTTFAGLIVPQYLVDMVALIIRSGRPFANSVTGMQLPDQGMSFIIPRGTTGAAVAAQATENTSVQNTDEVWANLTVPVNTIAGQQDVSRQSLERGTPGLDELVYLDLAGAYHAEVDRQGLAGSGTSNQATGLQNQSGIYQASAFTAAATGATFYSKVAGAIASVAGTGAGIDPRIIVMHPRRWGWLNSLVDSQNRPLIVPVSNGVYNAMGPNLRPGGYGDDGTSAGGEVDTAGYNVVGTLQGLPVITDANVPTSVGTGPEDLVWVYDNTKIILWEDGDGMPNQLRFEQTLGNQLTVKLVAYGYIAFTAGRYPTAVAQVGGNAGSAGFGLVAPSF